MTNLDTDFDFRLRNGDYLEGSSFSYDKISGTLKAALTQTVPSQTFDMVMRACNNDNTLSYFEFSMEVSQGEPATFEAPLPSFEIFSNQILETRLPSYTSVRNSELRIEIESDGKKIIELKNVQFDQTTRIFRLYGSTEEVGKRVFNVTLKDKLGNTMSNVHDFNVTVKEGNGDSIYPYKLEPLDGNSSFIYSVASIERDGRVLLAFSEPIHPPNLIYADIDMRIGLEKLDWQFVFARANMGEVTLQIKLSEEMAFAFEPVRREFLTPLLGNGRYFN